MCVGGGGGGGGGGLRNKVSEVSEKSVGENVGRGNNLGKVCQGKSWGKYYHPRKNLVTNQYYLYPIKFSLFSQIKTGYFTRGMGQVSNPS